MGLGAGEVDQGRAVAFLPDHAQIDLQPALQDDGRPGRPLGQHMLHFLVFHEAVGGSLAVGADRQDVEIAHRLLAAAEAAGHDDRADAGNPFQMSLQRGGEVLGHGYPEAALLGRRRAAHGFQQPGLKRRAEPRQAADAPFGGRLRQVVDGRHAEPLVQHPDALWAEARHGRQRRQGRRGPRFDLIQRFQAARVADFSVLAGKVVPDARQLRQIGALGEKVRRRLGQVFDGRGGSAVGPHAERVGALDLQKFGDPVEEGGDVGVVDGHAGVSTSLSGSAAGSALGPAAASA